MTRFTAIDLPIFTGLYDELNDLNIEWTNNQICMNAPTEHTNDPSFGIGRLLKEYKYGDSIEQSEVISSLRNGDWDLCSVFVGTQFETLFNTVKTQYKIGRMRLMKSVPKTCLGWHQDPVPRLHYPIKTHEGCLMVIENEVKFLPENEWWLTDTTALHTALNASERERIHIVSDLLP